MQRPETLLQDVSETRVKAAVAGYVRQKQLALEAGMSETELSRLLSDHLPKLAKVLGILGLEIVDAGHVDDLKRVLKTVL